MRRAGSLAGTLAGIVVLALSTAFLATPSARAANPQVQLEPAGPLSAAGESVTLTGSGFDAQANNGLGVYVVFGPRMPEPVYYTDALLYDDAAWIHRGAGDSPGQAEMNADGTFEVTLDLRPSYVDGHGQPVDCHAVACYVITMAAHGLDDRSQDTFTAVTFQAPAAATGSPAAATTAPSAMPPTAEPSTSPAATPAPTLAPLPSTGVPTPSPGGEPGSSGQVPGEAVAVTVAAGLFGGALALLAVRRVRRPRA